MAQKSKAPYLWVEQFRPQKIDDAILPNEFKAFFKSVVKSGEIPNLLLESSTPGSGKTSIAKAICAELNADYLYINISSESGIDTLRTTIKQFASTKSFTRKPKLLLWMRLMEHHLRCKKRCVDLLKNFIQHVVLFLHVIMYLKLFQHFVKDE